MLIPTLAANLFAIKPVITEPVAFVGVVSAMRSR